jgi:hypothetical protein
LGLYFLSSVKDKGLLGHRVAIQGIGQGIGHGEERRGGGPQWGRGERGEGETGDLPTGESKIPL